MSVLDILKMSGALPLNELNLRSSGSSAQLTQELRKLMDEKLVAFDGALPTPEAVARRDQARAADAEGSARRTGPDAATGSDGPGSGFDRAGVPGRRG
ncbi:MAG: hypothetical protein WDN04_00515 [Rhodospirillales bacterium]